MGAVVIRSQSQRFQPTLDQTLILHLADRLLLQCLACIVLRTTAEQILPATLAANFNPGLQRFTGGFAQSKRHRLLGLLLGDTALFANNAP